jgi:oxygen-dependent protoporphyrinogen oxidase
VALNDDPVVVVGGGIAGLAAALELLELVGPERVVLIERAPQLGGKIQTEYHDGFLIEAGPDSFLSSKPEGIALCRTLGIADSLVGTLPAEHRSSVRRGGRLYELPEGITGLIPSRLTPLLLSPLLSIKGRARAGLDLVLARRSADGEESIAGFVRRRLGGEAWDWLVEPLLSGIYAGDGATLSVDATFPQLAAIEREHRSLIRGLTRQPRGEGGPPFLTPRRGMGEIVTALETSLSGCRLIRGAAVTGVTAGGGGFRIRLDDGSTLAAGSVVLAAPAFVSARLVAPLDGELADRLDAFGFTSTATVALAYAAKALPRPLRGYGYLRPRAEGGPIVACTWASAKWPGRAPSGQVLLRAFVGRAGCEEPASWSEADLLALVRTELKEVLGITETPALHRIYRWPKGMPQYTIGHQQRLARVEQSLARHPGLAIAGHSYHGIGIPDCIRSGRRAARALVGAGMLAGV